MVSVGPLAHSVRSRYNHYDYRNRHHTGRQALALPSVALTLDPPRTATPPHSTAEALGYEV